MYNVWQISLSVNSLEKYDLYTKSGIVCLLISINNS